MKPRGFSSPAQVGQSSCSEMSKLNSHHSNDNDNDDYCQECYRKYYKPESRCELVSRYLSALRQGSRTTCRKTKSEGKARDTWGICRSLVGPHVSESGPYYQDRVRNATFDHAS